MLAAPSPLLFWFEARWGGVHCPRCRVVCLQMGLASHEAVRTIASLAEASLATDKAGSREASQACEVGIAVCRAAEARL
eukprot:15413018-Alexandrium_andersonii.AAC.1